MPFFCELATDNIKNRERGQKRWGESDPEEAG